MDRISKEEMYLEHALVAARASTCLVRMYGAVIVNNDEMISEGYNGAPRGCENCSSRGTCYRRELGIPKGEKYEMCRAVHAEQNALISASRRDMIGGVVYIVGIDVDKSKEAGCEVYAEPRPCRICARMLYNAGIKVGYGYEKGKGKKIVKFDILELIQQQESEMKEEFIRQSSKVGGLTRVEKTASEKSEAEYSGGYICTTKNGEAVKLLGALSIVDDSYIDNNTENVYLYTINNSRKDGVMSIRIYRDKYRNIYLARRSDTRTFKCDMLLLFEYKDTKKIDANVPSYIEC